MTFWFRIPCFKQQHEYKLTASPLYACLTKIDISSLLEGIFDFFGNLLFFMFYFLFLFFFCCICKLAINFYMINEIKPKRKI